jgi:uncharacterized protein (DUF1330 family)
MSSEEEKKDVAVYGVWHDTIGGDSWDMDKYVTPCVKAVTEAGGEILAWDMAVEAIEGKAPKTAVAMVKFPSKAAFDKFYSHPEYQDPLKMRLDSTEAGSWAVMVREGVHTE